jgi:mycothiol system anti-sigma-R factor
MNMTCVECMERLDSFVDRELSDADLREVRAHLEHCPPCEHVFQLRNDMKRLVKVCCDETRAAPGLRDRVRQLLSS